MVRSAVSKTGVDGLIIGAIIPTTGVSNSITRFLSTGVEGSITNAVVSNGRRHRSSHR